ncbi:hypothetical protein Tco_1351803 [Tanacetum coccineum]
MSKSAQAAPVRYGQMSVMLQSLPASCGLPIASLRSQSDSYGQLPAAVRSLSADSSLYQLSHPSVDPLKGRQCYLLSSISRSALRSEDSNCKGGDEVGSRNAGNTDAGGDTGSGGDGICGNRDDSGVSGDGGGVGGDKSARAGCASSSSVLSSSSSSASFSEAPLLSPHHSSSLICSGSQLDPPMGNLIIISLGSSYGLGLKTFPSVSAVVR